MIRLLFRHAVARRFNVRSGVHDSCSGYARFHSFNTTRMLPVLFPGFSQRPASRRLLIEAHDKRRLSGNITAPDRYEWIEHRTTFLPNKYFGDFFMSVTIASILNLVGPDMIVVLLIVLLLFGAKKLPELARGMGRAVKEFSAARDEIERGLGQSDASEIARPKLVDTKSELQSSQSS
jgi:sec-independent protein translocase protein TatA